jgi:cytochrome c oxidase subunit 4
MPLGVWLALLVLTGLNVGLAQVNLHGWNAALSLAIAAVQAVLIAVFLMRLRVSPPLTQIVGVAALVWLAILLLGTLDDVLTRAWLRG